MTARTDRTSELLVELKCPGILDVTAWFEHDRRGPPSIRILVTSHRRQHQVERVVAGFAERRGASMNPAGTLVDSVALSLPALRAHPRRRAVELLGELLRDLHRHL